MKVFMKMSFILMLLTAIFMAGCAKKSVTGPNLPGNTSNPTISSITPANAAVNVATNANITVTFSKAMNAATITSATFNVKQGAAAVPCVVSYSGNVATLNPIGPFILNKAYSVTVTTGVQDVAGNGLAVNKSWSFTTGVAMPAGPLAVNLGTASNFVLLSKSGIDTVPDSVITGDIGVSPIDSTGITGFSLIGDGITAAPGYTTSAQVTGKVYAADYFVPTPAKMTTAVNDMQTAYVDATGRTTPDFIDLGAGDISGLTLTPGLYKWGTGLLITTDVVLNGSPTDVWIFQIAGGLTFGPGAKIILQGGAKAKNIFWQTADATTLSTTAHIEGIVLSLTGITLATGASVNGRLLAQTAITLEKSTVTQPAP